MGTAAGVTNFCGLHANVHGEMHRVVQGIASDLLDRIDRLGGLNAPHLILGKIFAQAYDTPAYKIAADDLLAAHKVDILFHALGAGVVMQDERRINVLMVETKAGRQAVRAGIFIDCSGDGDLAAWAGAPFEVGDNNGSMLYPSMMFRLNGIDPDKAGEAWRTIPALMEQAEAAGTHRFPRKTAIPILRPLRKSSTRNRSESLRKPLKNWIRRTSSGSTKTSSTLSLPKSGKLSCNLTQTKNASSLSSNFGCVVAPIPIFRTTISKKNTTAA